VSAAKTGRWGYRFDTDSALLNASLLTNWGAFSPENALSCTPCGFITLKGMDKNLKIFLRRGDWEARISVTRLEFITGLF
jgi:hypothetical protein